MNSIPLGRAVELGATRVFVLQVGRIDRPLKPPQATVGGGAGLLRDRAPAPVRPRAGRAAGRRRVPRAAGPRHVGARRHAARHAATSPASSAGSTRRTTPPRAYLDEHAPPGATSVRRQAAAAAHRVGRHRGDHAALGAAAALAGRRRGAVTAAPRPLAGAAAALDLRPLRDDRLADARGDVRLLARGGRQPPGALAVLAGPPLRPGAGRDVGAVPRGEAGAPARHRRPRARRPTPTRASRSWSAAGTPGRATRSR